MSKTLTQDVFKGEPDWMISAAVDENGHAFKNITANIFKEIPDKYITLFIDSLGRLVLIM